MSRETTLRCDVCHRPTERIVAKMFIAPILPGLGRTVHSNYTHQCDVGSCCHKKLLRLFAFRERMTAKQYQEKRKNGTVKQKKVQT